MKEATQTDEQIVHDALLVLEHMESNMGDQAYVDNAKAAFNRLISERDKLIETLAEALKNSPITLTLGRDEAIKAYKTWKETQ